MIVFNISIIWPLLLFQNNVQSEIFSVICIIFDDLVPRCWVWFKKSGHVANPNLKEMWWKNHDLKVIWTLFQSVYNYLKLACFLICPYSVNNNNVNWSNFWKCQFFELSGEIRNLKANCVISVPMIEINWPNHNKKNEVLPFMFQS